MNPCENSYNFNPVDGFVRYRHLQISVKNVILPPNGMYFFECTLFVTVVFAWLNKHFTVYLCFTFLEPIQVYIIIY